MNYALTKHDEVITLQGECPRCKRGNNSLIIMKAERITEKVNNLFMECMCCNQKVITKVKS